MAIADFFVPETPQQPQDIRYCARLFTRFDLSRALVIHNGEILGIVSLTDMVMKGLRDQ